MELVRRWLPMLTIAAVTICLQAYIARRPGCPVWLRRIFTIAGIWVFAGPLFLLNSELNLLPPAIANWLLAATMFWAIFLSGVAVWVASSQHIPFDPSRRQMVKAAGAALAAAPVAAAGAGLLIARSGPVLREVDIRIPGLPADLAGLRIAQLSDIHFGPFLGGAELERAVAMANELAPKVIVVTGDLITRRGDDLEGCLRKLRTLKAEAGVFGCHGNHEIYAGVEDLTDRLAARFGWRFLRGEAAALRFGATTLNLCGVDYQRRDRPYLTGTQKLVQPGALNVLLSHNPDVFPLAAAQGFDITLSGHTHGGQVTVEILDEQVNIARFFTPYVYGLYRIGPSQIYVNAGIGTVGAPIRLGAPPEVSLIRLCAA